MPSAVAFPNNLLPAAADVNSKAPQQQKKQEEERAMATNFIVDSCGKSRTLRPGTTLGSIVECIVEFQEQRQIQGECINNVYVTHRMMHLFAQDVEDMGLASPDKSKVVVGVVMYTTAGGDTACHCHCWLEVPAGTLGPKHRVAGGTSKTSNVEVLDPSWETTRRLDNNSKGKGGRVYFSSFQKWMAFMQRHPDPCDPEFTKAVLAQLVAMEECARDSQRRLHNEGSHYSNELLDYAVGRCCK